MSPRRAGAAGPGSTMNRARNCVQERVRRQAAEILHGPVVGEDLHLVVRKRHRQHRRPVGTVAERRAGKPAIAHLGPRARGARRAMVAVGDVERGDAADRRDERVARCAADAPQGVPHLVGRREIDDRLALRHLGDDPIDVGGRAIRQEHRPRLRAEREHVLRAIVFLVAARALVLLDDVAVVLVDGEARGETGLDVAPHLQPVEIDARLVLHDQRVFPERRKIVRRATVHGVCVWIGAGRQLELGARHAQEAQRVAVGERAGLVGADNVVGNGCDAGGIGCVRTQRTKRMKRRHGAQIISQRAVGVSSAGLQAPVQCARAV